MLYNVGIRIRGRQAFCIVAITFVPASGTAWAQTIKRVRPVTYRITQSIEVSNHDVSALKSLELNLPIPGNWPEQRVRSVRITGDGSVRLKDREGLGHVVRSFFGRNDAPGPGESRVLSVSYSLVSKEIQTDREMLAHRRYRPYNTRSGEYKLYTRSEKLIEADDPRIVDIATGLKLETKNPYEFARGAYDYVIDHTEYATPSPGMGAVKCLTNGKADCGWYAALFVAICRAGGVPARPVAGCWAQGENQWHCWAEFKLPGVGWIPADPTAGDHGPEKREYYFGNLDNNRVALIKAYNLTFKADRGKSSLGFIQVGAWYWYRAPGATGENISVKFHVHGEPTSTKER